MDSLFDIIKSFGWLMAIGINLGVVWIGWSLRNKFVTREDCKQLCIGHATAREKMNDLLLAHAGEMREIKLRLDVMPNHDRMHQLELKLARIEGEQGKLLEKIEGLLQLLERVEQQTFVLYRDKVGDE